MISYIYNSEYGYINFHSEESYSKQTMDSYFKEENIEYLDLGIYSYILKDSTLSNFESFLVTIEKTNIKILILDFNRLKGIANNSHTVLNRCIEKIININIKVIVVNAGINITQLLDIGSEYSCYEFDIKRKAILGFAKVTIDELKTLITEKKDNFPEIIDKLFQEVLENSLNKCCEDKEAPIESSPVITTKYINIKKFIEESNFFKFCAYKLALNMINFKLISDRPDKNQHISLFCHTLNGSYITGLLSSLLCLDLVFFDHIGPKNKIYNTFLESRIDNNKCYIVISDVICLKSELRAVRTLLDYERANYLGAVSIVYCNTIKSVENNYNICSLFEINKAYNPLKYYIKTDLTEIKEG